MTTISEHAASLDETRRGFQIIGVKTWQTAGCGDEVIWTGNK
jgi:hypothetical protein